MIHPALFRTFALPGPAAGRSRASGSGLWFVQTANRLLRRLNGRTATGYRPERHYMRGGRTAGAKSATAG